MSAHLPDDSTRWPTDPYHLLGVSPQADDRTVRKAYTQLIRRFKPEQYPEQFRRIRAAYERVLQLREWLSGLRDIPPQVNEVVPAAEPAGEAEEPPRPRKTIRRVVDGPAPDNHPIDEVETYWNWALDGQSLRAYSALAELAARRPDHPDAALRLYWLAALFPGVDPKRPAVDWLGRQLMRTHLAGTAWPLYAAELNHHPAEALAAGRDFAAAAAPVARFIDVTRTRWRVAVSLEDLRTIIAEFERTRARILGESEEAWLRLVLDIEYALLWQPQWARDAGVERQFAAERRARPAVLRKIDGAAEQWKTNEGHAAVWRKACEPRDLPAPLLRVLADSWFRPLMDLWPRFDALIGAIVAEPRAWLTHFDRLHARCAFAVARFGELLTLRYERLTEPPRPAHASDIEAAGRRFLARRRPGAYRRDRAEYLEWCLREGVSPRWIADLAPKHRPWWDRQAPSLPQLLTSDLSMHLVCRSHELFWADATAAELTATYQ